MEKPRLSFWQIWNMSFGFLGIQFGWGLQMANMSAIYDKNLLLLSMTGVGIAWASILAMPYAILAGWLPPEKTGVYMGIFNFFIVIPEITASLAFGWVMLHLLNNHRLAAIVAGGVFMMLAAVLMQRVHDVTAEQKQAKPAVVEAVGGTEAL
ncbi:MAG: hypothetical protein HY314_16005 [Acidobacteria bacterium]|nr:hypothetical protein [Acidobacteriota bacterium]